MISNSEGQKRCSCKKSKCLKLYCDCFAAGFYCDETCSCQECYNTLDYEDTVEETRRQVKLKNPHAFSPKIHSLITQPPTSQIVEDGDAFAGKHIKGCNCKKSMCTKRYCECFQAKVGCSGECRCEGCKNVFGIREGYNAHNEFTLWTPFQHIGHLEDASTTTRRSMFNGCYVASPGSASNNSEMILGASNDSFDTTVPLDQHVHPNAEFVNQFTPLNTTQFNVGYPTSVTGLPPFMDPPNSSRANGDSSSLNTIPWPGSLNEANQVPLGFGGPIVNEFNGTPRETIHDNTINTWSTERVTSPGGDL